MLIETYEYRLLYQVCGIFMAGSTIEIGIPEIGVYQAQGTFIMLKGYQLNLDRWHDSSACH